MKFLYKIHSGFDGFAPTRIPKRLHQGKYLRLGWTQYLDQVSEGDECWIYFHGPHAFSPGVYIKGYINTVNRADNFTILRVREFNTRAPLTDDATSARIAKVVNVRYRQVFRWPEEWNVVPECGLASCAKRLCEGCPTWNSIPRIDRADLRSVIAGKMDGLAPAYWIIPNRCYVYREHKSLASETHRVTYIFEAFKLGEKRYAYPLGRGIYEALRKQGQLEFDAIVPIPLSPDKMQAGELHRTKALAMEVGRLLGVRVQELLSLREPISKRRMLAEDRTKAEFQHRYQTLLQVDDRVRELDKLLLIDDVITHGATLSCVLSRLRETKETLQIVAASAGQMIVKAAVRNEKGFLQ